MVKTIVIVGVTGIQGSSVAATFLAVPNWHVRGITRSPNSEAAKAQAAKGVEIVQGDLDDVPSLVSAFEGAHAIFANTDWSAALFYALEHPEVGDARQYFRDVEFRYGANIAEAAAAGSTMKTLERFVWSSLSHAKRLSKGKYSKV
jgi:uncharacterized protein YbjT (DUF2867 family)